ncbi:MAG: hypothetical protein O2783_00500 [Chloroflexi bacterium]|nr:hypothetical protein [Chloroflexota bacterium]
MWAAVSKAVSDPDFMMDRIKALTSEAAQEPEGETDKAAIKASIAVRSIRQDSNMSMYASSIPIGSKKRV